jgi:hypothetical protein
VNRLRGSLCLIALLTAAGCAPSELVPAKGSLTQGGKPLADATVLLMYGDGSSAIGVSDKDGNYALSFNGRNGTRPGKQIKLFVIKYDISDQEKPKPLPPGPPKGWGTDFQTPMRMNHEMPKNLLPLEYGDLENPKLRIDVPDEGTDQLDVALP